MSENQLEAICSALGDTGEGLTGGEIGRLLQRIRIRDPSPGGTKRWRLLEALTRKQVEDGCANGVLSFISVALDPALYVGNSDRQARLLESVNTALAFAGYRVTADGKLHHADSARTLSEAENRAARLTSELRRRGVHPEVLRFCRSELLSEDYFHAVLEAAKSVADAIRSKTGLRFDGHELVDETFGTPRNRTTPRLALNTLTTPTERSEQFGVVFLLKGVFSFYRNPTAHEPRINRKVGEQEAMDMLTLVSFLHREVERATLVP